MRAFVAVTFSASDRHTFEALTRELSGEPALQKARFTPFDRVHLTLKFFESLQLPLMDALKASLPAIALTSRPSTHRIERYVGFPTAQRATVLAAVLGDASGILVSLFEQVEEVCKMHGVAKEGRAFVPHVTLARMGRPTDVRDLLVKLDLHQEVVAKIPPHVAPEQQVTAEALGLYESVLGPQGPVYHARVSCRLGAASQ